jgi:hypothetical protein
MSTAIHPDIPDAATLREAVHRLTPETAPRWGRLSAPAMLEHCARFNELYLGRRRPSFLVRLVTRLFSGPITRRFASASPFEMKRGATTMPDLRVEEAPTDPDAFEPLRARLLSTLDEIEAHTGTWDHPLYGRIDAALGRALARAHLTHHLHQFGVLERDQE